MMKDLKAIRGARYIASLVSMGEHQQQDFKFAVSDARKIARSLSAFANHSGGHLLVGVKDNGAIAGLRNEEDIYVIEDAASRYCVPPVEVEFTAYVAEGGAIVLKAHVDAVETPPVCVREADGSLKAYFRIADENIAADALMVRGWRMRHADSADGTPLRFDSGGQAMLRLLAEEGRASLDQLMRRAHMSRLAAEETVTRLYAIGAVTFVHTPSGWEIEASDPS